MNLLLTLTYKPGLEEKGREMSCPGILLLAVTTESQQGHLLLDVVQKKSSQLDKLGSKVKDDYHQQEKQHVRDKIRGL